MSAGFLGQTILVLSLSTLARSQEYTIVPNSEFPCHSTTCFTLDQLAQADLTNGSNITLIFQPGEHTLKRLFNIHTFTSVAIHGGNTSVISFRGKGWIKLSDINQLSIRGLNITGYAQKSDLIVPSYSLSIKNTQNLFLSSCYFTSLDTRYNETEYGVVVLVWSSANVVIENIVFVGNNGTALSIFEADTAAIENSTFKRNQGQMLGGAINIYSVSVVSINNGIFAGNHANDLGGAVYIALGSMFISNSHLKDNTAEFSGGGIYVQSSSMAISHTALTGNTAYLGGGIFVMQGTAFLSNCNMTANTAGGNGGGIEVWQGNASISNCSLTGNSAGHGGGIVVYQGTTYVSSSNLTGNSAKQNGGGIMAYQNDASISNCDLADNTAKLDGGAIQVYLGIASISNCDLTGNTAKHSGGGIMVYEGMASISNCDITANTAEWDGSFGGGILVVYGFVSISNNCNLTGNSAYNGGGIAVNQSNASISNCILTGNTAFYGGGIHVRQSDASVYKSSLTGNTAVYSGGILVIESKTSVCTCNLTGNSAKQAGGGIQVFKGNASISNCNLTGNTAEWTGGGIQVYQGNASISNSILLDNIAGDAGSAISAAGSPMLTISDTHTSIHSSAYDVPSLSFIESQNVTFWGENTINNCIGTFDVFNSRLHFNGPTVFENNHGMYAGAIRAVLSQIYLNSAVTISNNTAVENGGGLFLQGSSLYVNFPVTISDNTASEGGAIYAYQSTVTIVAKNSIGNEPVSITNNYAINGGGIYGVGSILVLEKTYINIESNRAQENGGGLYLQQNSRIYILKQYADNHTSRESKLTISNNHAKLGGGIYVDDRTTSSGACRSGAMYTGFLGECFIQTFLEYINRSGIAVNTVNTFILNNNATQYGSAIYGGLLDRCTPARLFIEAQNASSGLEYIQMTVELDKHSISSDPLQVTLCDHSQNSVTTKKGHSFVLNVRAIDQVGKPVNATIHGAVVTKSGIGRLKEGQVEQNAESECTELHYNAYSEDSSAQVELYAEGPCGSLGLSKLTVNITFLNCTCPLGFHPSLAQSNIECSCECDSKLEAVECFPEEETFLLDNTLWIGAVTSNNTEYVVHDCPFDYCVDQPVNISLNSSQHIDRQCAYNRSGILCGECEEGLSLVFASSKCKECSNSYLLLLIPFCVIGIALVVFIVWLNITIATGTVYGLILYANVLAANKAIFLPFPDPNFLTVFVSWVNLDFGIETCFYNGMNSQAKVLLQLVFPAYLFLLMFLIIVMSIYVNPFARLLSNRNPVAALCTLLILSYSKLLRLIIAAFQFTSLEYTDSSYGLVWLYDANIRYFSPGHTFRFVAATAILTACVLFTTLLFFGQWFPRCSKWKIMKWTKDTKYIGFMDAFHAPFTAKHRYWVGLLLFALIAHNLAASLASDSSVPVLSAGCIAAGLIVYKSVMNRVYKSRLNDSLENLFLINIVTFALGVATIKNSTDKISYISMAIAFILFVMITCYHFYMYVIKKTNVWNNQVRPFNPAQRINFNFHRKHHRLAEIDDNAEGDELPAPIVEMYAYGRGPRDQTDPDKYTPPPIITPATRLDQLREPALDILAPVTEEDYRQGPPIPQAENCPRRQVTTTVVEISRD